MISLRYLTAAQKYYYCYPLAEIMPNSIPECYWQATSLFQKRVDTIQSWMTGNDLKSLSQAPEQLNTICGIS